MISKQTPKVVFLWYYLSFILSNRRPAAATEPDRLPGARTAGGPSVGLLYGRKDGSEKVGNMVNIETGGEEANTIARSN